MEKTIIEQLGFEGVLLGEQVQSIGEMTILPLISRQVRPVARPDRFRFRGTRGYGTMGFVNEDDTPAVIPSGFGVVSKQRAQDHALAEAVVVPAHGEQESYTAVCIQDSQPGMLAEELDRDAEIILPITLRKQIRKGGVGKQGRTFDRAWPMISAYLDKIPSLRRTSNAHLVDFYQGKADELAQFTAEFEPVAAQVGAVVFFGSTIVGIEVFPDASYWERYWQAVIRGCYGAEFLWRKLSGVRIDAQQPFSPILKAEHFSNPDVRDRVDELLREITAPYVQGYLNMDYSVVLEVGSGLATKIEDVKHDGVGDLVVLDDEAVYASMVW